MAPLYIQEKVHPKVLINDLLRRAGEARHLSPVAGYYPTKSRVNSLKEQVIFQSFHTLLMQQVSRAAPVHQSFVFLILLFFLMVHLVSFLVVL